MTDSNNQNLNVKPPGFMRVLFAMVGITFAGAGVALICFLWFGTDEGETPIVFKVFGSLIGLPFIGMGLAFASVGTRGMRPPLPSQAMVRQLKELRQELGDTPSSGTTSAVGNYTCPNCSAPLDSTTASPHGDVKCAHCGAWYNIYGK